MCEWKTLYKKSSTGKVQIWKICVDGNKICIEHGQRGGKIQNTIEEVKKGKNIGKENETTPEQQAELKAESKYKKQLDKGYVESLDNVDEIVYLPMLAHTFDKRKNDIKYPCCVQRKFDGCLKYDSVVELKNIGKVKIGEIVDGKYEGLIKSFNVKHNRIEYKKILNVFKNGIDDNEKNYIWYEIETESGNKIKITGNHRVWLPELQCWRRVDELSGNESFLLDF